MHIFSKYSVHSNFIYHSEKSTSLSLPHPSIYPEMQSADEAEDACFEDIYRGVGVVPQHDLFQIQNAIRRRSRGRLLRGYIWGMGVVPQHGLFQIQNAIHRASNQKIEKDFLHPSIGNKKSLNSILQ